MVRLSSFDNQLENGVGLAPPEPATPSAQIHRVMSCKRIDATQLYRDGLLKPDHAHLADNARKQRALQVLLAVVLNGLANERLLALLLLLVGQNIDFVAERFTCHRAVVGILRPHARNSPLLHITHKYVLR